MTKRLSSLCKVTLLLGHFDKILEYPWAKKLFYKIKIDYVITGKPVSGLKKENKKYACTNSLYVGYNFNLLNRINCFRTLNVMILINVMMLIYVIASIFLGYKTYISPDKIFQFLIVFAKK